MKNPIVNSIKLKKEKKEELSLKLPLIDKSNSQAAGNSFRPGKVQLKREPTLMRKKTGKGFKKVRMMSNVRG